MKAQSMENSIHLTVPGTIPAPGKLILEFCSLNPEGIPVCTTVTGRGTSHGSVQKSLTIK